MVDNNGEVISMARQKKPGNRTKSGRLSRQANDRGTKELQDRRAWLAGEGDPANTTYPLGILLANGAIGEDLHRYGCDYAWMHAVLYGSASTAAITADRSAGNTLDDLALQRITVKMGLARKALDSEGRQIRDAVEAIVVYERVPRWMRPIPPAASDVHQAAKFIKGMELLRKAFEEAPRRATGSGFC